MIQVSRSSFDHSMTTDPDTKAWRNALRSILVATDGSRTAGAALRVVSELSAVETSRVTVLTILESRGVFVTDALLDRGDLMRDAVTTNNVMDKVARQLAAVGLTHAPLRITSGHPGPAIADVAEEVDASLIVVGHGRHRMLPRMMGSETVSALLPYARVPMFVVHRFAQQRPSSIICAVDFGQSSLRAVLTAEQLAAAGASLRLVHVASHAERYQAGWQRVYESGIQSAFDRLRVELHRKDISVTTHILTGDVTPAIIDLAQRTRSDLVAVGAHNRQANTRYVVGSTTMSLLRAMDGSLLISPDYSAVPHAPAFANAEPMGVPKAGGQ